MRFDRTIWFDSIALSGLYYLLRLCLYSC